MFYRHAVVFTLVLGLSCIGVPTINACATHNIDVKKAKEKAQEYARQKIADPNRNCKHFATDCLAAFPGHNHYVRCSIFYQDADRKQMCKERIEVYLEAHRKGIDNPILGLESWTMYIKHTSAKDC